LRSSAEVPRTIGNKKGETRVEGKSLHDLLAYSVLFLAIVVVLLNALGDVLEAAESFVGDSFKDRARRNVSFRINEKVAKHPLLTFFDDPKLSSLVILARRSLDSVNELIHLSSYTLMGIFSMIPALILAATLKWWIPLAIVSSMLPLLYAKAINERKSWDIESFHASTFNQLQLGERMLTHQDFAKDLRLFTMQEWILRRWSGLYQSFLEDLIAVRKKGSCQISLWSILSGAGVSVPFVYVVNGALLGDFTVGDVSLLIGVIVQIRNGLAAVIYNGGDIIGALLATKPLTDLLDLPEQQERVERSGGERSAAPGIRLKDVCFRYVDSAQFVLRDVNLSIASGERFAIVGENGSGKSTLVKLICGFYRPTSGQVRWDGEAVGLASDGKHRERMSAVFQDYAKFPLSVRENIDARRTGASDDDIRMVLKEVGLDELVGDLDRVLWKGVDGGIELSGVLAITTKRGEMTKRSDQHGARAAVTK
jgi:ATP-binding cassette, subfamily B, bacterial